jgi:hypothetical protein
MTRADDGAAGVVERVSVDDDGRWMTMASRHDPASMLTEPRAERVLGSRDSIDA